MKGKHNILVNVKSYLLKKWGSISEHNQIEIINFLFNLFNYLINAILLSLPTYIFLNSFNELYYYHYFLIVICFLIGIPYFEYYYVWLRDGWKDNK